MPLRVPKEWRCAVGVRLLLALVSPLAMFTAVAAPAKAQQPPAGKTIAVPGYVMAYQQVDVYARIAGNLKEPRFDIGDRVKKDQLLVEVDAPELAAELKWKNVLVTQATVGVRQAKQAALMTVAAARKSQIQVDDAKGSLKKANAVHERWRVEYEREVALVNGRIDPAIVNQDLNQLKAAEAAVQQAKARFDAAECSYAEALVTRDKADVDIQAAEVGVDLAKADMERVRVRLDCAKVLAPFDGVVIRCTAAPNMQVGPTTSYQAKPLFTVARTDMVRVVVEVAELDALAVLPGARATIRFPALKGTEFTAMVARTAGAIDRPTGTRRVEILLVNRDNRLLPGMFANVTLQMQAEEPRKKGIGEKPPPAPKNAEALQATAVNITT